MTSILEWMHKRVHGGTMQYLHPAYRDNRNCTVRALRDALGIHLISAYVLMREQGRKHGRGVMLPHGYYRNIAGQLASTTASWPPVTPGDYGRTIVTAQRALAPPARRVRCARPCDWLPPSPDN